jgi:hypothetical protein
MAATSQEEVHCRTTLNLLSRGLYMSFLSARDFWIGSELFSIMIIVLGLVVLISLNNTRPPGKGY